MADLSSNTVTRGLTIGDIELPTQVVLAPMAGVTNSPYRRLCASYGQALYVGEMISAQALAFRNDKTMKLASFHPAEKVRSSQIAAVDPEVAATAVKILVEEIGVHHIDINFGCPMRKVTRHGGGGALPFKQKLFSKIVAAAVDAAGDIPVTIKMRTGIDRQHQTYLKAGKIAAELGVKAIGLHARSVKQLYSSEADWTKIAALKEAVDNVPILGNGDIWEAQDALDMISTTGCDGVIIGRGCLGRPWLFAQLEAALENKVLPKPPTSGEVAKIMETHATMLCDWFGAHRGVREFRKHTGWYLKGYPVGGEIRRRYSVCDSLDEILELCQTIPDFPLPPEGMRSKRGHTRGPQTVALPERWLDDPHDDSLASPAADITASGG